MTHATDMQSLFAQRAHLGDFLNAEKITEGIGLALSGGGYRAMLYHAGAIRRLNELGLLPDLCEVASVSGGSITAGVLARAWNKLRFDAEGRAANLEEEFVAPLMRFAKVALDVRAGLIGLLPGRSAGAEVAIAYDKHLFHGASLQDLPDKPRFTFMATNLESGSAWRFAKDYAADHRVGRINNPQHALAKVVAASSAFPPFLSPVEFDLSSSTVEDMAHTDMHRAPFTQRAFLTDGGVFDNLGLERIWKRCRTVFVSNAGLTIPQIGSHKGRWVGQVFRVIGLIQLQADSSRRRILFGMSNLGQRDVAYWSTDEAPSRYGTPVFDLTAEEVHAVSSMRVRLSPFTDNEIELLLRAGHAGAAASLEARRIRLAA